VARIHASFPNKPFKFSPNESYKGAPHIRFQIQEDGTVSDAAITRSSGVEDIDKKLLHAVAHWRYKPRPVGCGVIDSEMSVAIDWQ